MYRKILYIGLAWIVLHAPPAHARGVHHHHRACKWSGTAYVTPGHVTIVIRNPCYPGKPVVVGRGVLHARSQAALRLRKMG